MSSMYSFNHVIKTRREELGLTQGEFCYGLCAESTFDKIEKGTFVPNMFLRIALCERLGLDPNDFSMPKTAEEMEMYKLKHKISIELYSGNFGRALEYIDMLEKKLASTRGPKIETILTQFIRFSRLIIRTQKGNLSPEEELKEIKEILAITIKDFDHEKLPRHLLAYDELSVINYLAYVYYEAGQKDHAISILYALKSHLEMDAVDRKRVAPVYSTIVHNLSGYIGHKGNYDEVIRLCDEGIHINKEFEINSCLSGLLFNKGCSLAMLGRKEEAGKHLCNALALDQILHDGRTFEAINKFAEDNGIILVPGYKVIRLEEGEGEVVFYNKGSKKAGNQRNRPPSHNQKPER